MNHLIPAAIAASLFAAPTFAETKTYDLKGFTSVSASAGVSVNVAVGGDYSVRAESTSEGLERLKVELVDDELRIGRKNKTFNWGRGNEVTVDVRTPSLNAIDVSSGAALDATGIDASAFAIDVSSGASLDASGRCDALTVDVSSGGNIDARTLECRSADASASSGGNAEIFASESINGDASSGGNVNVFGKPGSVNKDTSSGGSVSVE